MEEYEFLSPQDWLNWSYGGNDLATQLLAPGVQQEKEFNQAMFMQTYQNWWNSEKQQMERAKAAGISPYAAASAIAGGESPSVSGPSSSAVGATAQNLEKVAAGAAGIANAATGGAASLAEAAYKTGTLEATVESLSAGAAKDLAEKGLTEEQIYAWTVDNKYKEQTAQADLRNKILTGDNLSKQYEVMHAQYELTSQQIDTELAKLKLLASEANNQAAQAEYYQKLKIKTDLEASWQQQRNDFWKQNGYDIMTSSTDAILVARLEAGLDNTEVIKTMSKYYGDRTDAEQNAVEQHAYGIAYGQKLAEYDYDWSAPPKTVVGAIWRTFDSLQNKLSKRHSLPTKKVSENGKESEQVDNEALKKSYEAFIKEKALMYTHIQCLKAEMYEKYGDDCVGRVDDELSIKELEAEYNKLPTSFREFKKYVYNQ